MNVRLKNSQAIRCHFLTKKRPLTISRQMRSFQEKNSQKIEFLESSQVLRIFFSQTMHLMENRQRNFFSLENAEK